MVRQDSRLPGGGVDVGIDFRREDGLVPQHFLHDAQVGTVLDQVGGEGVAEGVRGDFFPDAGEQRLLLDQIEDGHPAERAAVFVEERHVVEGRFRRLRTRLEVLRESVCRHFPEGDQPLLVALAHHAHEAFREVDLRDQQAAGFGDAQTAAVEDFEDRAVAQARPAGRGIHGFEDGCHFLHGKDLREVSPELGGVHAVAGVVFPLPFQNQPVEEGTQRTQQARLGALGERLRPGHAGRGGGASFRPAGQVALDVLRAHRTRLYLHRSQELGRVPTVGGHGVG